jgi:Zn-dependent peptidase ImmA (M78 family)
VDVVSIAQEIGIRVWEMNHLPEGVSGQIWRDPVNGGTSGYSIGVRATESLPRKRFTVAHELAHYILHRNRLDGGLFEDVMFRGGLSSREETQANQMAADILMPFKLISKLMDDGESTLEGLAQRLQVSLVALKIRLGLPV